MDKKLMNITNIEMFFEDMLKGKVSENIFFTNLPLSIKQSWTDMVLVDMKNAVYDEGGYGRGYINVYLYAQPLSNGSQNAERLSKMEAYLGKAIDANKDEHYHLTRYYTATDYDERRNLHCNVVTLILQIV